MKKILITGGAGFGGSGIIKELLKEKSYKIKVIDVLSPNHATNLRKEIDNGLITYEWKSVQDIKPSDVKGYEIVCHFAAQPDVPMGFPSPSWTGYENVEGTIRVLEAIKNLEIEKFILPSSGNVFGRPQYVPIDESHPLTPHNPYAASKAAQELYARAYQLSYDIPLVVFRNGIVYGPGMRRDIFIFIWLKNVITGKPLIVQGGDQTRDPCYVTDTVDAWVRAIKAPADEVVGQTFQVSRGREYKIDKIAKMIQEIAEERWLTKPKIIHTDYRPGEKGQRECFDISNANKILKYNPKVNLSDGLRLTMDWVENLGMNNDL